MMSSTTTTKKEEGTQWSMNSAGLFVNNKAAASQESRPKWNLWAWFPNAGKIKGVRPKARKQKSPLLPNNGVENEQKRLTAIIDFFLLWLHVIHGAVRLLLDHSINVTGACLHLCAATGRSKVLTTVKIFLKGSTPTYMDWRLFH